MTRHRVNAGRTGAAGRALKGSKPGADYYAGRAAGRNNPPSSGGSKKKSGCLPILAVIALIALAIYIARSQT